MKILLELFLSFLKIGCFSFGGGYAMIALVSEEVVEKGWISNEQLIDFLAISESTPGPFTVNASTYIGKLLAGYPGAIVATIAALLPSIVIICLIAKNFEGFLTNKYINSAFTGLKPVVIALIGSAIVEVGKNVLFPDTIVNETTYLSLTIAIISLLLSKKLNPIIVIGLSGLMGIVVGFVFF